MVEQEIDPLGLILARLDDIAATQRQIAQVLADQGVLLHGLAQAAVLQRETAEFYDVQFVGALRRQADKLNTILERMAQSRRPTLDDMARAAVEAWERQHTRPD